MKAGDYVIAVIGMGEMINKGKIYKVSAIRHTEHHAIVIHKTDNGSFHTEWSQSWFKFYATELTELERVILEVME